MLNNSNACTYWSLIYCIVTSFSNTSYFFVFLVFFWGEGGEGYVIDHGSSNLSLLYFTLFCLFDKLSLSAFSSDMASTGGMLFFTRAISATTKKKKSHEIPKEASMNIRPSLAARRVFIGREAYHNQLNEIEKSYIFLRPLR